MKGYESIFITAPDLSEESQKAIVEKIQNNIVKHGGDVVHYQLWGRRVLGYTVKKFSQGVYHMLYFTGSATVLDELQQQYRYSEEIIKFQTILVSDMDVEKEKFNELLKKNSILSDNRDSRRPNRPFVARSAAPETLTEEE